MSDDEQIAHSRAFATWVRYLPRSLVEKIFVSFTNGSRRDRDSLHLLAKLLQRNKSVTLVLSYLKFILAHKLQLPALEGTRSLGTFTRTSGSLSGREMEDATRGDAINAEFDLAGINLASLSTSALQLVAFCSSCSRDGPIRVTNAMVQVNWTSGSLRRLRSLYQEVDLEAIESSRPGFVSLVTESALADTAADADSFLTKVRPVLLDRASFDKRLAGSILGLLRENSIAFTQVKIQLLHDLSAMAPGTFSVKSVLEGVVQWLTPRLTSDVPLSEKELCATETLGKSQWLLAQLSVLILSCTQITLCVRLSWKLQHTWWNPYSLLSYKADSTIQQSSPWPPLFVRSHPSRSVTCICLQGAISDCQTSTGNGCSTTSTTPAESGQAQQGYEARPSQGTSERRNNRAGLVQLVALLGLSGLIHRASYPPVQRQFGPRRYRIDGHLRPV